MCGESKLACPAVRTTSGWLDLFPLPCAKNAECRVMGAKHLCCKGFCTKAVLAATSAAVEKPVVTSAAIVSTTNAITEPPPQSYFKVLPIKTSKPKTNAKATTASSDKNQKLVCPKGKNTPIILFPIPCENNNQCRKTSGPEYVCCGGRCVAGVKPPKPVTPKPTHLPLLGVIPRECPSEPLGELLFEVQTCKRDADCWPRICCPDGKRSYCRTAKARLDLVPVASQINAPVRAVEQYLQCTAPPAYDLFPRPCSSSLDCFPNLCCAEGGKRHCRPPQRSLLALLAGVGRRVGTTIGNLRQAAAAANANRINEEET